MPSRPSQAEIDQALDTLVRVIQYYVDDEKSPEKAAVLYPAILELGSLHKAGAMFAETLESLQAGLRSSP